MNTTELSLKQSLLAFLLVATLYLFVAHLDYLQTI